jgi:hypothetical protein
LNRIEARLKQSKTIQEKDKAELLRLLKALKREITDLSRTHSDEAESISAFAELSAREATRREKNPRLLKLATEGLTSSVDGFEASHPRLMEIVNAFCTILSNLGI